MVLLALSVVAIAIVLLSIERIPIEVSSLAIVVLLASTGLLTAEEALAGFSSETAIFIFALLALTQGLGATGVMQLVGRRLLVFTRVGSGAFVAMLLLAVCVFSSVASNTAVTAAFLPVAIASARQARVAPGLLLMPMAFSSMLGGTITLFGSSTNLVVSAAMREVGLPGIGFLELTPLGIPLAGIGIAATLLLARRLLRARRDEDPDANLVQRTYLTEAVLTPGSRMAGKELDQLTGAIGLPVAGILRAGHMLPPDPEEILREDDHLVISGSLDDILRVKDLRSVGLRAERQYAPEQGGPKLVEVLVPPTSALVGRTVRGIRFAERYGMVVLALHRHPAFQSVRRDLDLLGSLVEGKALRDIALSAGDVLLVSGPDRRIRNLARDEDVAILGAVEYEPPRYRRAALAIAIFATAVVVAGAGVASPAIAGIAGMLLMIATGCVRAATAFRVDWRVVIMIGALLALGRAMEKSGAGELLAEVMLPIARAFGARGALVALMAATIALSVPMSNQAAALVMLPIAVHLGMELGLAPRTFAMGVCFAASCSFVTPLEPSAALVFGPGRYRFADFLRVGAPLTALMLAVLAIGIPLVWPFTAR